MRRLILVSLVLILGFLAAPKARANTYACDDGSGMGCFNVDQTGGFSSINDYGAAVVFIRCRATYGDPSTYCFGFSWECEGKICHQVCVHTIVSPGGCICTIQEGVAIVKGSCAFS
jgi:hypothetical protein